MMFRIYILQFRHPCSNSLYHVPALACSQNPGPDVGFFLWPEVWESQSRRLRSLLMMASFFFLCYFIVLGALPHNRLNRK